MRLKENKWLKPYFDLDTELWSNAEINFQGNICENLKNNISGKLVEKVSDRNWMVSARFAGECKKLQCKINYDHYKENEVGDGGDFVIV